MHKTDSGLSTGLSRETLKFDIITHPEYFIGKQQNVRLIKRNLLLAGIFGKATSISYLIFKGWKWRLEADSSEKSWRNCAYNKGCLKQENKFSQLKDTGKLRAGAIPRTSS